MPLRVLRRTSRLVAAVLVAVVTATGASACSQFRSNEPAPPPIPTGTAAPDDGQFGDGSGPLHVRYPWKPGKPQLGVQVYWGDSAADSDSTLQDKAGRMVAYLVGLDANAITISFPFHTAGPTASTVGPGPDTPSPARLEAVVRIAQAACLRITLRPLLDEASLVAAAPDDWRGNIAPADRNAWFGSYRALLAPYLTLAQRTRVQTFVIGTELTSLQDDPRWSGVVGEARSRYKGELTYAENWNTYVVRRVSMDVARVGVDAYPPMPKLGDDATIAQLVSGWNQWLDQKTTGPLPSSLFYEVGAPAEDGAYHHPGIWGNGGGRRNYKVQQNWFEAACQVARSRKLTGLYWWRYDLHQDPATADPLHDRSDSWLGRPAAETIKACFDGWAAAAYRTVP